MKCFVCEHSGKTKEEDGHKICLNCGSPVRPLTEHSLMRLRKAWHKRFDDYINGHKRGSWADQPDVMVCP
jgi:hypothetical protein